METLINQFAQVCNEKGLKTQKAIFKWLNGKLQKDYKGRATKEKIKFVAEDLTKSICLKLGIPQDGI